MIAWHLCSDFLVGVAASLKEHPVINHQLVYFDEIGFDQLTGLICDGHASKICCYNDDPISTGGKNGDEASGVGSWVYPDGLYVRRACNGCIDVQTDTFQLQRTTNTTILVQNRAAVQLLSGIYRCIVPLNTSDEYLVHYVGIYEREQGMLKYSSLRCD